MRRVNLWAIKKPSRKIKKYKRINKSKIEKTAQLMSLQYLKMKRHLLEILHF